MSTQKMKAAKKSDTEKRAAQKQEEFKADVRTKPLAAAAFAIEKLFKPENPDLIKIAENLADNLNDVLKDNENFPVEAMLLNQAQTLQAIFYYAVETIADCQMINHVQIVSEMAFKANNACRKTLLALNHIKNPTNTTFIKQQNNAVNQQVNNNEPREKILKNSEKNLSNELLLSEVLHEELDTRSKSKAGAAYSKLAAVEDSGR